MCHTCGEAIVVAVANLGRGDRVILVDDRQCTQSEQGFQRRPGVQIAPAALAVLQSEQDLGDGDLLSLEQLLVGMREANLPHGGGGLALLQAQGALGEAELAAPEGDGTRGHQDDLLPPFPQPQQVLDERFQPAAIDATGFLVHQQ